MSLADKITSSGLSIAILHTAAYADVFDYALTSGEIHRYLSGVHAPRSAVEHFLQDTRLLTNAEGYYTLPGREMLADTRRQRERVAARLWPQAIVYGRVIAGLPFVRMVAVTGALAMNNVEEGADIDFLIVTEPGRLWFCRALVLLLAGRLAALQGVTLCPNYLVSLRSLDFPDKTLYAAHEIAQMVPLAGLGVYAQLRQENTWVASFLPNAAGAPDTPWLASRPAPQPPARLLEAVFNTTPFTSLERWEMNRKIRKLRREQAASPESDFSADCCKGHAHRHQAHTRAALEKRLSRLQRELFL